MSFQGRIWLCLYMGASVILAREQRNPEQRGKSHCYQFNSLYCSFEEAENYCRVHGGQLAYTSNEKIRELIRNFLKEGTKWWVKQNQKPQKEHQGRSRQGRSGVWC
jgi:hypothetical protein